MAGQIYFDDVQEGQELPSLNKKPEREQLVKYAAGSGDFNPLHYDDEFAKNQGVPGVIAHGRFKYASLGQLVSDWMGYQGRIKKISCQYRGMDFLDQPFTCKGLVKRKYEEDGQKLVELEVWTENGEGQKTTPGTAIVALPSR